MCSGTTCTWSLQIQLQKSGTDVRFQKPPALKYLCGELMVRKDALIFYIGAHHAVYAIGLSKLLEDRCRVIAVEGNPEHASGAKA